MGTGHRILFVSYKVTDTNESTDSYILLVYEYQQTRYGTYHVYTYQSYRQDGRIQDTGYAAFPQSFRIFRSFFYSAENAGQLEVTDGPPTLCCSCFMSSASTLQHTLHTSYQSTSCTYIRRRGTMDAAGWPLSRTAEEGVGSLLSNEDVLASLTRREAVQKDVHQALAR